MARYEICDYEVGGAEIFSYDTLDEACKEADYLKLIMRKDFSVIDTEIDGCGSEVYTTKEN